MSISTSPALLQARRTCWNACQKGCGNSTNASPPATSARACSGKAPTAAACGRCWRQGWGGRPESFRLNILPCALSWEIHVGGLA